MTTMCDRIPYDRKEWEEWGNPNEQKYHDYMLSYSPDRQRFYTQNGVRYPQMLLVSGLNDPRRLLGAREVGSGIKARNRERRRDAGQDGHERGATSLADRYRYLRELAFDYAWLLDVFGKAESPLLRRRRRTRHQLDGVSLFCQVDSLFCRVEGASGDCRPTRAELCKPAELEQCLPGSAAQPSVISA